MPWAPPLHGSSGVSPADGAWDAMVWIQLGLLVKHPDTHSFPRQTPHDGSPRCPETLLEVQKAAAPLMRHDDEVAPSSTSIVGVHERTRQSSLAFLFHHQTWSSQVLGGELVYGCLAIATHGPDPHAQTFGRCELWSWLLVGFFGHWSSPETPFGPPACGANFGSFSRSIFYK